MGIERKREKERARERRSEEEDSRRGRKWVEEDRRGWKRVNENGREWMRVENRYAIEFLGCTLSASRHTIPLCHHERGSIVAL